MSQRQNGSTVPLIISNTQTELKMLICSFEFVWDNQQPFMYKCAPVGMLHLAHLWVFHSLTGYMVLQWLTLLKPHNIFTKVCVCQGILGTGVCSFTNSKRGLVFQSASESNLKRHRVTRGVRDTGDQQMKGYIQTSVKVQLVPSWRKFKSFERVAKLGHKKNGEANSHQRVRKSWVV